jgi:predicted Rossmann-fold nucleotide-binding protein
MSVCQHIVLSWEHQRCFVTLTVKVHCRCCYWYCGVVVILQALVDFGTIAQDDVDSLFFTDDAQEAADYLIECLSRNSTHNGL